MPEATKTSTHGSEADKSQRKRRARAGNDKKIADDEFMAAAIGDVEWLKQSLREAKGQINYDKNGLSSLHLAAIHGRLECLKLLIEKYKFDINMASTTGWRAIHLCISNQTGKRALQCLNYLLSKNADSSVANNDGITPVHQAASEGHVQCVKQLIEVGASISGKDCRGHTPLDLAKLWGHKKCARILAAESWHQGKDHVAKEMEHLKKLRLQQIAREMEDEDEYRAAQEFYGEKAYQDWLKKQNLPMQHTGPNLKELEKEKQQKKQKPKSSLYKANSMQQKPAVIVDKEEDIRKTDSAQNVHVAFRSPITPSPIERRVTSFSDDLYGLHEKHDQKPKTPEVKPRRARTPGYVNPNKWKIPLKVPKKEYINNLQDDYPRDQYTKMPKVKSAPMYYDGRHGPKVFVTDENAKVKKLKLKDERDIDLPQEVIDRVMSKDSSRFERPIIFKSVHIHDVNQKKKYDVEQKGRPEIALHMCDDVKSQLFQSGLVRAHTFDGVLPSSTSSSKSATSDWASDKYPREKVVNAMRNMAGPSRFPNIKGEEYMFNFGDVTGV